MFKITRLKLSAWYLLIIFLISSFFSLMIYRNVSGQIEVLIQRQNDRMRIFQEESGKFLRRPPAPPMISTEELRKQKKLIIYDLIFLNTIILIISGGAGYFLASKTLKPIKMMMEKQEQFVSDASHELRTPMAVLQAEMEGKLLEKNISDKEARKLIISNLEELTRLKKLTNNLLSLTTNQKSEKSEEVNIDEIVKEAKKQVLTLAKNKKIEIETQISEFKIQGNKEDLTELLVILLENAIKYSANKTKIKVSNINEDNKVKITIKDQGIGIAKENLPHIFERFYRVDKSRSETKGFGLGLAIAKKIVECHHGLITVKSEINKGSTFTILLPVN